MVYIFEEKKDGKYLFPNDGHNYSKRVCRENPMDGLVEFWKKWGLTIGEAEMMQYPLYQISPEFLRESIVTIKKAVEIYQNKK